MNNKEKIYSCEFSFDLIHKQEILCIKCYGNKIEIKNKIGTIFVNCLNNCDTIIDNLKKYIKYLHLNTLKNVEISSSNFIKSNYSQKITTPNLALILLFQLNFEEILRKDDKMNKELSSIIYQVTHSYPDFLDSFTINRFESLPNVDSDILIKQLDKIIKVLNNIRSKINEIFIWDDFKNKYRLKNTSNQLQLPKVELKNSKYHIYQINTLVDLLSVSINCINLSELALAQCSNCQKTFCIFKNTSNKNEILCSNCNSDLSSEISALINKIRSYLNKRIKNNDALNKKRKYLKEIFESDLKAERSSLKKIYKENYNSYECQKKFLNWLKEYLNKLHSYFPDTKKIGNKNARK